MEQNDYRINLSVEGNESTFYTQQQFNSDNHFQLKNTSFFANNRSDDFKVIDSVQTTSVDIYAGYTEENELIVKSLDVLTDEEKKYTVKVGTSGVGTFYYYSDNNNSEFISNVEVPVVNCLRYENSIDVISNSFYINSLSAEHGIFDGNYVLNVPATTPLTVLNNGKESNIRIVSGEYYGNKNVYGTDADGNYDFYTGKIMINVVSDFNTVNLYTFKEGNIDGNSLIYTPACNINSLRSKL